MIAILAEMLEDLFEGLVRGKVHNNSLQVGEVAAEGIHPYFVTDGRGELDGRGHGLMQRTVTASDLGGAFFYGVDARRLFAKPDKFLLVVLVIQVAVFVYGEIRRV